MTVTKFQLFRHQFATGLFGGLGISAACAAAPFFDLVTNPFGAGLLWIAAGLSAFLTIFAACLTIKALSEMGAINRNLKGTGFERLYAPLFFTKNTKRLDTFLQSRQSGLQQIEMDGGRLTVQLTTYKENNSAFMKTNDSGGKVRANWRGFKITLYSKTEGRDIFTLHSCLDSDAIQKEILAMEDAQLLVRCRPLIDEAALKFNALVKGDLAALVNTPQPLALAPTAAKEFAPESVGQKLAAVARERAGTRTLAYRLIGLTQDASTMAADQGRADAVANANAVAKTLIQLLCLERVDLAEKAIADTEVALDQALRLVESYLVNAYDRASAHTQVQVDVGMQVAALVDKVTVSSPA